MKPLIKNTLWGLLGLLLMGTYLARQEFNGPVPNQIVCMTPDGRRFADFFDDQQASVGASGVSAWQSLDKSMNMTNFPCAIKLKPR